MLAAVLVAGCFEEAVTPIDDESSGTAGTTSGPSGSITATGPEPTSTMGTTDDPTAGPTTQSTLDGTSTESTGDPLPIACGDGLAAPGELCFEDTTVVMANDATYSARIGDVSGPSSGDLVHLIPDQVVVRVGDGAGNFGPAVFDASVVSQRMELADLDDDGELDLLVGRTAGALDLLLGSGAGSFAMASTVTVGAEPRALAIGDVDGDGSLDAVVGTIDASVHVTLGDGMGGLMALPPFGSLGPVTSLALADLDGDGVLDLALAVDGGARQGVDLRRGLGNGTFGPQEPSIARLPGTRAVAAGDLDGDGSIDLAYVSAASDALGVLWGNERGNPTSETTIGTGSTPSTLVAADFDNDGRPELAVGHADDTTLRVFVIEPERTITEGLSLTLAAPITALAAGDVNDDGVPDLAATSTSAEIVTVVLSTP
ncbi:FG-GAP repeat domain-containing protein [Paraliomyxa miuraensis]|uniref:FG-GAP repeat domain-containing protein n=1 Tax=Paraliomyxa miuraensis TaxID=376150 RepID=UPI00224E8CCE|nr:VCBS repeat-containing protein [Paraliomyxa miuraensis]